MLAQHLRDIIRRDDGWCARGQRTLVLRSSGVGGFSGDEVAHRNAIARSFSASTSGQCERPAWLVACPESFTPPPPALRCAAELAIALARPTRHRSGMLTRLAALSGLVGAGIAIHGCSLEESRTGSCSPPPEGCPRSTFTTPMTEGVITFSARSPEPSRSVTLQVSDGNAPAEGRCSINGLTGEIASDERVITIGPYVFCTFPDGYLYVSLHPLSDLRNWPVGTHAVRGSEAMLIELCDRPGRTDRGCTMCRPKLDDAFVTVVIEEAEGGPAPYPDMVTPNYRRHYRIEVDTGALSADECEGLNVSLALRFEQTAAQFVNDPHGECGPCL